MTITNYGTLKTEVAAYLHRSDLSAQVASFCQLAHNDLKALLRTVSLQGRTTITVNEEFENIPDGAKQIDRVTFTGDSDIPLEYVSPDQFYKMRDIGGGKPRRYTIIGTQFQFTPVPSDDYTLSIVYQAELSALSDDSDTNVVLTDHPAAYLFAALHHAYLYLKNDVEAGKWRQKVLDQIQIISDESVAMRHGSTLRIRSNVIETA